MGGNGKTSGDFSPHGFFRGEICTGNIEEMLKSTLTLTRSKDAIIYGKKCLHRVVGQSTNANISACEGHCPSDPMMF